MILKRRVFFTICTVVMIFVYQSTAFTAVQLVKSDCKESKKTKQEEVLESWQINNTLAEKINYICSLENKDIDGSLSDVQDFLIEHGHQVTVVSNALRLEDISHKIVELLSEHCFKLQKIELAYCDKIQIRELNNLLYNNGTSLRDLRLVHMKHLTADTIKIISTQCRYLQFLCLSGCSIITNNNLANIGKNLVNLKTFYLHGTQGWSFDAIKLLYEQRPGIKIFTDNFFSSCLIS